MPIYIKKVPPRYALLRGVAESVAAKVPLFSETTKCFLIKFPVIACVTKEKYIIPVRLFL